jgi:RNA polymerase sigma factor (sigma-70 family)
MTQEEFEHIAPSLRDVMLSVGRSFFDNESDADDVAQEGLLALWKYSSRMDADAVHTALAIRIAKHCCMDIVRKRKTTIPMPEDYGGAALNNGTAQSPQEIMEQGELLAAVDNAINRLTPSERRLYELRQIEGLPLDDIVKQTNISKTSVKSMISAARKKIYEELKRNLKKHDI